MERAAELLELQQPRQSMRTQCKLLGVHHSTAPYQPVARKPQDARLCRIFGELCLRDSAAGCLAIGSSILMPRGDVGRFRRHVLWHKVPLFTLQTGDRWDFPC